jgi:hypothetical protein
VVAAGGMAPTQEIPVGQGGTASTGRQRRTAEVAKALGGGGGGGAGSRQALALYGPTRESSLVTEAHALRYAKEHLNKERAEMKEEHTRRLLALDLLRKQVRGRVRGRADAWAVPGARLARHRPTVHGTWCKAHGTRHTARHMGGEGSLPCPCCVRPAPGDSARRLGAARCAERSVHALPSLLTAIAGGTSCASWTQSTCVAVPGRRPSLLLSRARACEASCPCALPGERRPVPCRPSQTAARASDLERKTAELEQDRKEFVVEFERKLVGLQESFARLNDIKRDQEARQERLEAAEARAAAERAGQLEAAKAALLQFLDAHRGRGSSGGGGGGGGGGAGGASGLGGSEAESVDVATEAAFRALDAVFWFDAASRQAAVEQLEDSVQKRLAAVESKEVCVCVGGGGWGRHGGATLPSPLHAPATTALPCVPRCVTCTPPPPSPHPPHTHRTGHGACPGALPGPRAPALRGPHRQRAGPAGPQGPARGGAGCAVAGRPPARRPARVPAAGHRAADERRRTGRAAGGRTARGRVDGGCGCEWEVRGRARVFELTRVVIGGCVV